MKILVAGATGAIGRPLMSTLSTMGHEAIGMTSSQQGLRLLRERGTEGVIADALDAPAVEAVVKRIRPDVVIEELTSLPKHYTPAEMRDAAERDRRLRLEGGSNVHQAAKAQNVRRYIVQSTGFYYAPGPGLAKETDPLAFDASPSVAGSVQTYTKIEERVLGTGVPEGVALRYGFFYGPGTWFVDGADVAYQIRENKYPIIGSGQGVYSWVHIDDAAAATAAAIECSPGVYNVVDDDPAEMSVWLPAFARSLGAPPPPNISEDEAGRTVGADAVYYATRLRGASNGKAKREFGFSPRRLEWLQTGSSFAVG
jgi:nucleoside-diphosphate-sugar epimerase